MRLPLIAVMVFASSLAQAGTEEVLSQYFQAKAKYQSDLKEKTQRALADEKKGDKDGEKRYAEAWKKSDRDLETLSPMLMSLFGKEQFKHKAPMEAQVQPRSFEEDGCVDGVKYFFDSNKYDFIFATDFKVLEHIAKLSRDTPLPKNARDIAKWFLDDIACNDSTHLPVTELDVGRKDAYAFTSVSAQDSGPFPPDEVVVIAPKGSKIYVIRYYVEKDMPRFANCEKESDSNFYTCYEIQFKRSAAFPKSKKLAISSLKLLP